MEGDGITLTRKDFDTAIAAVTKIKKKLDADIKACADVARSLDGVIHDLENLKSYCASE